MMHPIPRDNQSCEVQAGIWIAPLGANETLLGKMKGTLSSLCAPAKILQSVVEAEPLASLGYIGTEDGVLATWPNIDDELSKKAPFDHRETSWYITAKSIGKTTWTNALHRFQRVLSHNLLNSHSSW